MIFVGVDPASKPKIQKILGAVETQDFSALTLAVRSADETLRASLVNFLSLNHIDGWQQALSMLTDIKDVSIAMRAAAVCLLLNRKSNV